MWSGRELNPRHEDFQSSALPTELPDRLVGIANITNRREKRILCMSHCAGLAARRVEQPWSTLCISLQRGNSRHENKYG